MQNAKFGVTDFSEIINEWLASAGDQAITVRTDDDVAVTLTWPISFDDVQWVICYKNRMVVRRTSSSELYEWS